MHDQAGQSGLLHYLPFAIVLVAVALRMLRMNRMRRLRVEWLWVVPAIYLVLVVAMFVAMPPSPLGWGLSVAALAVGAGLGWQRGRMMHIHVDPQTHAINQKASPAAMLFLVALVGVRFAAREALGSGYDPAAAGHAQVMLVTDVLLALAFGLLAATRAEMFLRARRLLDAARAARAA